MIQNEMSLSDFQTEIAPKRTKFHNRKLVADGESFDSQAEYRVWQERQLQERSGEIRHLKRQVRYELQPRFKHEGKWVRAITYEADFEYEETATGKRVVEDVKGRRGGRGRGTQTEVFNLKRKLFLYRFPEIEFRITYV
jgi:hypothetical protein